MKLEDAFRSPFDNRLPSSQLFDPKTVTRPEMTNYSLNGSNSSHTFDDSQYRNSHVSLNGNVSSNVNSTSNSNVNPTNNVTEHGNSIVTENVNSNVTENVIENVTENVNLNISKTKKKENVKESFKISIIEHNELVNNLMVYGTGGIIILLLLELISKIK